MLNIEFRSRIPADESGRDRVIVVVNGVEDERSFCLVGDPVTAHVYQEAVIQTLIRHSFKEIGETLAEVAFDLKYDWFDGQFRIEACCNTYFDAAVPSIRVELNLGNWEDWNKPWSMSDLANEFEARIRQLDSEHIEYYQEDSESILGGFGIQYFPSGINAKLKTELEDIMSILRAVIEGTLTSLAESAHTNSVLTYFRFPNEIRVPCEQYLIYFAQFIADMGVAVDTELKNEVNRTLFRITPKDKSESLEKIREALSIYLKAPTEENFLNEIATQKDVAAKQWEANVYHLKSQLALQESILELKQTTDVPPVRLSGYQNS